MVARLRGFLVGLLLLAAPTLAHSQADVRIDCLQGGFWVACGGGPGQGATGYPVGSTPVTGVFTGANTAGQSASLAAVANVVNYLCTFNITGLGATAATPVTPTISGLSNGNTFTYTGAFSYALGATVVDAPFSGTFAPCQAANAVNTAIVVTVPGAAGNTNFSINLAGYRQ